MHFTAVSVTAAFQPLKLCMGIISAPVSGVREALARQLESIKVGMYTSIEHEIDWATFFVENGLNYNMLKAEIILFQSRHNRTIYTTNLADGWWSLYSNMMERAPFDGYFFSRTLENDKGYYIFEMKIWKSGFVDRHVRTLKTEDGWEFLNEGNLALFENAEQYKKRRISDRLNREAIELYSEAAGFPISTVVDYEGSAAHFYRP